MEESLQGTFALIFVFPVLWRRCDTSIDLFPCFSVDPIYGYFMNMKTTFRGKGSRSGLIAYLLILTALILFSTWLQGWITARLTATAFARLARTIAATAAGFVQVAVLFPLEKYVLFRKE